MSQHRASAMLYHPRDECWYRFADPVEEICARRIDEVVPALRRLEAQVHGEQLYAVGYVSYEAASAFDGALLTHPPGRLPLVYFALFRHRAPAPAPAPLNEDESKALPQWYGLSAPSEYAHRLKRLHAEIGAGNVYQVNYTERLCSRGPDDELLWRQIAGQAPYASRLDTDAFSVLCASPELFFSRQGEHLQCKPMKGTAARHGNCELDQGQRAWLENSPKNRAENLMITDMVRNDLGRIARPGSVSVPQLFDVEGFPTVWQMTSTVEAQTEAPLVDVFAALFPGASITGAPKRASMTLIHELEATPREIYTGAMGLLEPDGSALFSIAIRTAWLDHATGLATYGVGGGIVWDSLPGEEYAELQTKTAVLGGAQFRPALFETMRRQASGDIPLLPRHLARLQRSAESLCIRFDAEQVNEALVQACAGLPRQDLRLRLVLNSSGTPLVEHFPMPQATEVTKVALASTPVAATDPLLRHKLLERSIYERAAGEVPQGCEALLFNDLGHVTESAIGNIVYRWQGALFTPPLSDGLLPGVLRETLLEQGDVSERSLPVAALEQLDDLFLVNALRGWRRAQF